MSNSYHKAQQHVKSKENVFIKQRSGILKHNQIPKKKKGSSLTAQGADHDEFYSYEGGPNESQKAPRREECLSTAFAELLKPAAWMISCLWGGKKTPALHLYLLFYLLSWLYFALTWSRYGCMNISRPPRYQNLSLFFGCLLRQGAEALFSRSR